MQKMYETGKPDYVAPFGLNDDMSRQEFIDAGGNPMVGETYDDYGRDGAKGPVAVANYTNMHIGDQGMQSLISIDRAPHISMPCSARRVGRSR